MTYRTIHCILEDDMYTHYKVYNSKTNDFIMVETREGAAVWLTCPPYFYNLVAVHKNNIENLFNVSKNEEDMEVVWDDLYLIPVIGVRESNIEIILEDAICMGKILFGI